MLVPRLLNMSHYRNSSCVKLPSLTFKYSSKVIDRFGNFKDSSSDLGIWWAEDAASSKYHLHLRQLSGYNVFNLIVETHDLLNCVF